MCDEEAYSLEEYRRRRDAEDQRVPCPKCGELVHMLATRCPHCGVHFQGAAFQFRHPSEDEYVPRRSRRARWLAWALLAAIAILLLATALF